MTIILKSSQASGNTSLVKLSRDPLLDTADGGVVFMFDLSFQWCYPGNDPVNGVLVRDVSETANGDVQFTGTGSVAFAGGGFDWSGLTADPACVRGPAGCLAGIFSGEQYFLVAGWEKLPLSGDWNTSSTLAPLFCTTSSSTGYSLPEADLLTVSLRNVPAFSTRRQTSGGSTVDERSITSLTNFYGQVCQWAYWRNAAGVGVRLRSALGTQVSTSATIGAKNTGDFSTKRPQWGVPDSFNNLVSTATHAASAKRRTYRGWIENLKVSGRNPLDVLDADWSFCTGRGLFS